MTTQQKIIKNKFGLLELAQMLGNVSQTNNPDKADTLKNIGDGQDYL